MLIKFRNLGIPVAINKTQDADTVLGCVIFGEIQKRICHLTSMDSSASKKRKIRNGLFSMTTQTKNQTKSCVQFQKQNKNSR